MKRFALLILAVASASFAASPELGVRCISRSPLYWRYNVGYDGQGLPYLLPTHGTDPNLDQHWPKSGETVKFTASIVNHGDAAAVNFQYRWYLDGQPFGSTQTYTGTVAPGAVVSVMTNWTWPANLSDHTIGIVVDPNMAISDPYRQNNTYTDNTNALSFSIWVEQGLYDRFNAAANGFGTKSFEDWLRWQFDALKNNFLRSAYPVFAPNGVLEKVKIEEINVVPFDPNNLNNWRDAMNADPHVYLNDSRWQFTSEATTLAQKQADWDNYVAAMANQIDWGLVHECMHQLGAIDEYRLNLPQEWNHLTQRDGTRLDMAHYFATGGLMGGGYVLPTYDGNYLDSVTAGYFNMNLHKRRGYYGEFAFDMPLDNRIVVRDIYGNPLAGAHVEAYQKNKADEQLYDTPVFSGYTDDNGVFPLPNRPAPSRTTATGHTLHDNPFGNMSVVGQDCTMLFRISSQGQEDYRWFETNEMNLAYWMDQALVSTYTFDVDIIPVFGRARLGTTNIAVGHPATASSSAGQAAYIDDGDTTTIGNVWQPNPPDVGQWCQVDLGAPRFVARAIIYGNLGNPHDWYSAFHLEASKTGQFKGEQSVVPLETNWDYRRGAGDYSLQALSGFGNRNIYTFPPVRGRYFRIVSDVFQNWVGLQELELYEMAGYPEADANGDGVVDLFDLTAMLVAFGSSAIGLPEDANGDGVVDLRDLNIALLTFGQGG